MEERDFSNVPVIWEPKEDSGKLTRKFMKRIQEKYNPKINDYWDLHKWSIEHMEEFYDELWQYLGIIHSKPYHQVFDRSVPMSEPQEWFLGAELNFAENLLRYRDEHVALIVAGEDRETEKVTYAEVYDEVRLYAAALRKQGVKKGDRVSCFMSNRKEAVLAMLAATSIGAIWLGALPLMGAQAVLNRFEQTTPKVLFTVDRFLHNGEEQNMLPKLKLIANGLSSLEKLVIVASKPESKLKDISCIKNGCFLDDFLQSGRNQDGSIPEMIFEQLPFSHPVFINYTSGTTGLPKAIVHNACGLLTVTRDLWMAADGDREDCWLSMSPVGWASWNVFATMLFFGVTVVLFDGLPYFLSPSFLWDMIDEFNISRMIFQPSILDTLEEMGYIPTERHHLNSLKMIVCGGSMVKPQNLDFVYKKVKSEIIFVQVYGSTEVMGSCSIHDGTIRNYAGEVAAPSLGIDFQCVNESGEPVLGEIGDVVINSPTPGLFLGIWGDSDRSVLKKTYFETHPGKFSMGDLGIINPVTRGIIICGRSDETLKTRGCRFGSSEIYNVVHLFPEVSDCLCVAHYGKDMHERAILFLKMKQGCLFNENLVKEIEAAITRELSARHVPQVILETVDIPYNMNGKKMEMIVKKIINKMSFSTDAVVNAECLENFKDIPELRDL